MRKRENSCRRRSVEPQTAYVFTFLADEASRIGSCPPPMFLTGRVTITDRVTWTLLDEQFDASRQLFADVEAPCPLTVVPVEGIPIWPVTRSGRWALGARGFAAANVLLAVDDAIRAPGTTTQIGPSCSFQRHAKSLHKTRWSVGNQLGGLGW
jgi:hypothetical protein